MEENQFESIFVDEQTQWRINQISVNPEEEVEGVSLEEVCGELDEDSGAPSEPSSVVHDESSDEVLPDNLEGDSEKVIEVVSRKRLFEEAVETPLPTVQLSDEKICKFIKSTPKTDYAQPFYQRGPSIST